MIIYKSILLLILGPLALWPACGADEPVEELDTRIYTLESLTREIKSRNVPASLMAPPGHHLEVAPQAYGCVFGAARPVSDITANTIAELIRNRIEPDSWDAAKGTSIEERGGCLVIVQSERVHKQVQKILTQFTHDLNHEFNAQILLVDVGPDLVAGYLGKGGAVLDDAALKAMLSQGKIRAGTAFLVRNKKSNGVVSGRIQTQVDTTDVTGSTLVPITRESLNGFCVELTPALATDLKTVSLNFRFNHSDQLKATNQTVGRYEQAREAPAIDPTKPATEGPKPAAGSGLAEANASSVNAHSLIQSGTLTMPLGRWVLGGILPLESKEQPGQSAFFLVQLNRVVDGEFVNTPDMAVLEAKDGKPTAKAP